MARLRKRFLILTLALGAVLAAIVVWRGVVVQTAAHLVLSSQGLGDAQFEIVAVGPTETVVENASLGTDLLRARRIRLTYDPADLVAGRLRDLRIEGLRIDTGADRDGTLARLIDLASGTGGPWIELPRVTLEDAVIALARPVDGSIAVSGDFDLSGATPGATLDVGVSRGPTTAAFKVRSEDLGEGGVMEIRGGGESELAGMPLPGRTDLAVTGGRARFTLEGTVELPAAGTDWTALLLAGTLSLRGDLTLSEVTTPARPGVLAADIGWGLSGEKGVWRLDLPRPARLALQGLAPEMLTALRLPAADGVAPDLLVDLFSEGPLLAWWPRDGGGTLAFAGDIGLGLGHAAAEVRATATVEHDASWRLSSPAAVGLRIGAAGLAVSGPEGIALLRRVEWVSAGSMTPAGDLDLPGSLAAELGDVRLAGVTLDAAAINGDVRLRHGPGGWSLAAEPGLTMTVEGATAPGRLRIDAPVRLIADRLDLTGDDAAVRLDGSATLDRLAGAFLQDEGREVAFSDGAARVTLALALADGVAGELRLADASVTLPAEAIGLNAIAARLPLAAHGGSSELSLAGEMRDTGRTARFSPITIDLTGERSGEAISFGGEIAGAEGALRLPVKGSADIARMTGRLEAGPRTLAFRKGGLQPAALSPQLAMLRDVTGAVRVSAAAEFAADGTMQTGASLAFKDLSARMDDLEVAGLAGTVRLSQLSPLATAGPQRLTALRLVAGVPIDNPRMHFTLLPRRRGIHVRLHEIAGAVADGEVAVQDAAWSSAAPTNAFDVQIRAIAIERLLRDWQIEALSGTGHVSGILPVRIGPAGIAVLDGRLDSAGAGVIRVDWGAARETLVNSGEQVALTVNALEDFHYKTLSIGVDQPEGGDLTLAIGLEGANPAVLDGYPFRLNVNLSGQLAPIMAAVREGRRIGAELLQGGLGSRP